MADSPLDLSAHPELARYSRQVYFAGVGVEGQRRLRLSSVTLVGCGALGSALADQLVRAGLGHLQIVDRDFVELDNLQRQRLFDEQDVRECLPKAEAAARKLRRINSGCEVDAVVADANPRNIERFCSEADLLLDGTDNLESRYLINDVAVKTDKPWVYGACVAADGLVLAVRPQASPCLRCIWPDPPGPGELPTCDTAGILGATVNIVAALQAGEAMKILMGREEELLRGLTSIDAWHGRVRTVNVQAALEHGTCSCCQERDFEFLAGKRAAATTSLCGRNAVQIMPADDTELDLRRIAGRIPAHMRPACNGFLLKFQAGVLNVALFVDGRAIVQGTTDASAAKNAYAKYVGH